MTADQTYGRDMAFMEQHQQAQRQVGEGSDAAKLRDNLTEAAENISESAKTKAAAGTQRAAESIERTGESLRNAGRQLGTEQPWLADLAERAADGLGQVSHILQENDLRGLLTRAEGFARQQPVLFSAGAFALGFAAIRAAQASLAGSSRAGRGAAAHNDTAAHGELP